MTKADVCDDISEKILNQIKTKILKEVSETVFNAICQEVQEKNKEIEINNSKQRNAMKLNKTINSVFECLKEDSDYLFSEEIIEKVKQPSKIRSNTNLTQVFCDNDKVINKTSNTHPINKNTLSLTIPGVVYFCKDIPNAIEIPKGLFDNINHKLKKNVNDYHFFTVKLDYKSKFYYITYAEQNKYTKREIVAIYLNNEPINVDNLPYELKEKYDFY